MKTRSGKVCFYLVLFLCSACGGIRLPDDSGAILFQDSFISNQSGWDRYRDDVYLADYDEGSYRIAIFESEVEAWGRPGLEFSDTLIDVKARKIQGPDNNVYGLICRYQDPGNFYFFLISSDGYAGVGVYRDGARRLLSGDSMLPADSIQVGEGQNAIHAECVGDRLTLAVNGNAIYELHTNDFVSGDVGLIAGSYNLPGVVIEFDDVMVSNP